MKKKICEIKVGKPSASWQVIHDEMFKEFSVRIPRSAIGDLLRYKDKTENELALTHNRDAIDQLHKMSQLISQRGKGKQTKLTDFFKT